MFAPYHQFQNASRLERCVQQLDRNGHIPPDVSHGYQQYHYALRHKLRSAMHNLRRLEDVLTNSSDGDIVDTGDLLFQANMYLDGFFYCGGSALDILAREVLIYFGIPLPNDVYYRTARQQLDHHRPGDALRPRLDDPTWLPTFRTYRNAATHELLLADMVNLRIRMEGDTQNRLVELPLPNNPRAAQQDRRYTRHPNSVAYCEQQFRRLLRHVNSIYGDVRNRAEASGALPL